MHTLLRQVLQLSSGSQDTDAELLRRFVDAQDADAFAQLVRRYGGLVWGQCRHLLTGEADADDAFQATFLVLARSAKSIRSADRIGPWLHGVAYRVCQNARRQAARQARREQESATSEATHPVADSAWESMLAAVHEELHGLPEKLRTAFILCYLEGKSTSEAAAQLGLKLGTFSSHLSRARERLLARLSARGMVGGVGVLAVLGSGPVRAALVERVMELVLARAIPTTILTLTKGVLLMGLSKLKMAAVGLVLAGVLTLGGLWTVQAQPGSSGGGYSGASSLFNPLQKAAPPSIPEIQAEIDALRALANARERELKVRQAVLEQQKAAALAKIKSEFRYVSQEPGYAPSPADLEKLVKENEKDGYRFVGIMTMSMPLKENEKLRACEVPTLVFRREVMPAGMGGMMGGVTGMMPAASGGKFDPVAPARLPQ